MENYKCYAIFSLRYVYVLEKNEILDFTSGLDESSHNKVENRPLLLDSRYKDITFGKVLTLQTLS